MDSLRSCRTYNMDTFQSNYFFSQGVSDYTFVFGRHPRSPKVCWTIIGAG
jgi:hypothetical protein